MAAADAIQIVEHAYRLDLTTEAWLRGLAEAARLDFDRGGGAYAMLYDVSLSERPRVLAVEAVEPTLDQRALLPRLLDIGGRALRSAALERFGVGLVSDRLRETIGAGAGAIIDALQGAIPGPPGDLIHASAVDPGGVGILVGAPCPRGTALDRRLVRRWSRIFAYVESGLRLRRALGLAAPADSERAEAVLAPDGRAVHAAAPAQSALEALREAAVRIDRARAGRGDDIARLDLWPALVAGRWSIVEHFERDGRRYLVAVENEPGCRDPRALTTREREVVHFAASGCSDKEIAYTLGLSPQRVASHLSSARRKLGVRSRVELVALVRALADEAPGAPGPDR